jgi:hypothetical protein
MILTEENKCNGVFQNFAALMPSVKIENEWSAFPEQLDFSHSTTLAIGNPRRDNRRPLIRL